MSEGERARSICGGGATSAASSDDLAHYVLPPTAAALAAEQSNAVGAPAESAAVDTDAASNDGSWTSVDTNDDVGAHEADAPVATVTAAAVAAASAALPALVNDSMASRPAASGFLVVSPVATPKPPGKGTAPATNASAARKPSGMVSSAGTLPGHGVSPLARRSSGGSTRRAGSGRRGIAPTTRKAVAAVSAHSRRAVQHAYALALEVARALAKLSHGTARRVSRALALVLRCMRGRPLLLALPLAAISGLSFAAWSLARSGKSTTCSADAFGARRLPASIAGGAGGKAAADGAYIVRMHEAALVCINNGTSCQSLKTTFSVDFV